MASIVIEETKRKKNLIFISILLEQHRYVYNGYDGFLLQQRKMTINSPTFMVISESVSIYYYPINCIQSNSNIAVGSKFCNWCWS
jgi:hypothetical protein